jgi:Zn-dependent protease/CBS domain-containing protein
MNASVRLGTIFGIPIGFHWSLTIVFVLLVTSLGGSYFPDGYPGLSEAAVWTLAVITGVLFFASILLHELGHAVVARREGIPVTSITLFVFGGLASIGQRSPTARTELRIAAGGPVVSLILAAVFWGISLAFRSNDYVQAPSSWLAVINLSLLLFNLIPGFPLDGGRILRALVWQYTGDERRASRIALFTGQIAAFGLMGLGGIIILNGDFASGIWFIVIGWFLQNAAVTETAGGNLERMLEGVRVEHVMRREWPRVPIRLKVRQLVDDYVLGPGAPGQRAFMVDDDGIDPPRGLVTLTEVAKIPQDRWDWTGLADIMVPWPQVIKAGPTEPLLDALRTMTDAGINQMPVVTGSDGLTVVGLLTREQVLRYLRLQTELGQQGRGQATATRQTPGAQAPGD